MTHTIALIRNTFLECTCAVSYKFKSSSERLPEFQNKLIYIRAIINHSSIITEVKVVNNKRTTELF